MDTMDLVKLLQAIQVKNIKLSKQLNDNSEQLSREIKVSKTDIQKELTNITKNLEVVKADSARIEANNEVRFTAIEERLNVIEKCDNLKRKRTNPDHPTSGKNGGQTDNHHTDCLTRTEPDRLLY